MTRKQSHKEAALSFLHMVVEGKIREAYEKYISPDFRHHNTYFKGDRESLLSQWSTCFALKMISLLKNGTSANKHQKTHQTKMECFKRISLQIKINS